MTEGVAQGCENCASMRRVFDELRSFLMIQSAKSKSRLEGFSRGYAAALEEIRILTGIEFPQDVKPKRMMIRSEDHDKDGLQM